MAKNKERRILSAMWRVWMNRGAEQYRALDRLQSLTNEEVAFDLWLTTNPNPELVSMILEHRALRSPVMNIPKPGVRIV